jgi:hypothetical protein
MPKHFKYRGFISYSQMDKAAARRVHDWLEAYRVPPGVGAPLDKKRSLGRFFRDDDEMGAAADIGAAVRGAIEDSESLAVLCSPRAARSKWVNAEILHFRRSGRNDKIFAFIIDGVPNSGDPSTECFPPALRRLDGEDPQAMPIEPFGLDLRKESRSRICARYAAGVLGLDFDQLWRRELRRSRQTLLQRALALAAVLFVGLGALGAIAEIARRNDLAQTESEYVAFIALAPPHALVSVEPERAQERARRFAYLAAATPIIVDGAEVSASAFKANDTELVLGLSNGNIVRLSLPEARATVIAPGWACADDPQTLWPDCGVFAIAVSDDGAIVAGNGQGLVAAIGAPNRPTQIQRMHAGIVSAAAIEPNGAWAVTAGRDGAIIRLDLQTHQTAHLAAMDTTVRTLVIAGADNQIVIAEDGRGRAVELTGARTRALDVLTSANGAAVDEPLASVSTAEGLLLYRPAAARSGESTIRLQGVQYGHGGASSVLDLPPFPQNADFAAPSVRAGSAFAVASQALGGESYYFEAASRQWRPLQVGFNANRITRISQSGRYLLIQDEGFFRSQAPVQALIDLSAFAGIDLLFESEPHRGVRQILCQSQFAQRLPNIGQLGRDYSWAFPGYYDSVQLAALPRLDLVPCLRQGLGSLSGWPQVPASLQSLAVRL